jgi:hypothetical protein
MSYLNTVFGDFRKTLFFTASTAVLLIILSGCVFVSQQASPVATEKPREGDEGLSSAKPAMPPATPEVLGSSERRSLQEIEVHHDPQTNSNLIEKE